MVTPRSKMYIASNWGFLNGYRIVRRIIIKEITVNAAISIFFGWVYIRYIMSGFGRFVFHKGPYVN